MGFRFGEGSSIDVDDFLLMSLGLLRKLRVELGGLVLLLDRARTPIDLVVSWLYHASDLLEWHELGQVAFRDKPDQVNYLHESSSTSRPHRYAE